MSFSIRPITAADDAAMAAIDGLDRGTAGRIGPDPDEFNWIPE